MGHCCSKSVADVNNEPINDTGEPKTPPRSQRATVRLPTTDYNSFTGSPFQSPLPAGVPASPSPARTPGMKFRWPLPPPSPAKPIMSAIKRRLGKEKQVPKENQSPIAEGGAGMEGERELDKNFGYSKNFGAKFEIGKEVGRGHFGHTCWAKGIKGSLKGQSVAVKIISKAKMTTAIAIEDVRREVKILKALCGHKHMIKFHDVFEDSNSVYVVMELCKGGELLDRILSRGGRYNEEDAKSIVEQMLSVVSFCHLQGVVHRDLKPENFLFTTRDEDAPLKVIDFGLSDFIGPDKRLNDIVGSAYYVAPEVLHRSYNVEADLWSIGVITYILLCGSRPFWSRTESGIFRSVLRANPNFSDSPWPAVSPEAKDFVRRLLNKDHRKRMTAAQALTHPWLRDQNLTVPLDILIYKLVKSYLRATPFKRAALKSLSKALTEDELVYLRAQFRLLEPKDGFVSLSNFKTALMRHATEASFCSMLEKYLKVFIAEFWNFSLINCVVIFVSLTEMNPITFQSAPPPLWLPVLPPDPPRSNAFWETKNVYNQLKELQETVNLAESMKKELEMLMVVKNKEGSVENVGNGSNDHSVSAFSKYLEDVRVDLESQETLSVEAASSLMTKLRAQLEPFRFVAHETTAWEEKSAAIRLVNKAHKSKRNKLWRKRKRKRVAEMLAKEREQFEQADQEADEWRAREIAKDIAKRKVEKMHEIAKLKAKEERKRLESELELVLIVEKLQELRSIRIQKLKKQGHFLPEEDDKFLERVRAAVEEEERQALAAADTDAAKDAIATAEESRKTIQNSESLLTDGSSEDCGIKECKDQLIESKDERETSYKTENISDKNGSGRPGYTGVYDSVANLPMEFYHYYHGSNTDMGTLIEVRRTWDAYIRPGGSRIPGHWVQPPRPSDEKWASYLVRPK